MADRERSYGIVPLRRGTEGYEFLVIKARSTGYRSFPKGHIAPRESPIDCAVRELYEETGYVPTAYYSNGSWSPDAGTATLVSSIDYTYTKRSGQEVDKTVQLFMAQVEKRGEIQDAVEVDSIHWFPATAASAAVFDVPVKRSEYLEQILPLLRN